MLKDLKNISLTSTTGTLLSVDRSEIIARPMGNPTEGWWLLVPPASLSSELTELSGDRSVVAVGQQGQM